MAGKLLTVNIHLLNLVRQILEAMVNQDNKEVERLKQLAVKELMVRHTWSEIYASAMLRNMIDNFLL